VRQLVKKIKFDLFVGKIILAINCEVFYVGSG